MSVYWLVVAPPHFPFPCALLCRIGTWFHELESARLQLLVTTMVIWLYFRVVTKLLD